MPISFSMPNSEKKRYFLSNMEILICQIAEKRYVLIEYGDPYMPNNQMKMLFFFIKYGHVFIKIA